MRVWIYSVIETTINKLPQEAKALLKDKALLKEFQTALSMLKCVIESKESDDADLNTVDEMLTVSLNSKSIKNLLEDNNLFSLFSEKIKENSNGAYFVSNITAEKLCTLAREGEIEQIKEHDVSSYVADTIVDQASMFNGMNPEFYLKKYNALMIAIAHRQINVVKYFIEEIGARLDIKGGRYQDVSMLECAGRPENKALGMFSVVPFFPAINNELQDYLREKTTPQPKRSYRDAVSFNSAVSSENNISSLSI